MCMRARSETAGDSGGACVVRASSSLLPYPSSRLGTLGAAARSRGAGQARSQRSVVFVHCVQGLSRSAAIVCAYLMDRQPRPHGHSVRIAAPPRGACPTVSLEMRAIRKWPTGGRRMWGDVRRCIDCGALSLRMARHGFARVMARQPRLVKPPWAEALIEAALGT